MKIKTQQSGILIILIVTMIPLAQRSCRLININHTQNQQRRNFNIAELKYDFMIRWSLSVALRNRIIRNY
jgi:hypothetical protein